MAQTVERPYTPAPLVKWSAVRQAVTRVRAVDARLPAVVFACHWVIVTVVAAVASNYAVALPEVPTAGYRLPPLTGWQAWLVQPLRNWDGYWYGLIAEQGYAYHPATTAFWPLYPWMMSLGSQVSRVSVELVGLLLSNLAFFLALVALHELVRGQVNADVAKHTLWLTALFPTAFYFSAVYTESVFLLFSVLAFQQAQRGRWQWAGTAGAFAALTRNAGGLLVVPLLVLVIARHGRNPRRWPRGAFAVLMPAAAASTYLAYLWLVWGDPFLTFKIQSNWGRSFALPWHTFAMTWDQLRFDWVSAIISAPGWRTLTSYNVRWSFAEHESLDVAAALVAAMLLVVCFRRLPFAWGLWCLLVLVPPLFSPSQQHPLMSMPRYMLVLFPLFVAWATLLHRRWTRVATYVGCILLLCVLTTQFATWFWVA